MYFQGEVAAWRLLDFGACLPAPRAIVLAVGAARSRPHPARMMAIAVAMPKHAGVKPEMLGDARFLSALGNPEKMPLYNTGFMYIRK